jgi:hypothetical protein
MSQNAASARYSDSDVLHRRTSLQFRTEIRWRGSMICVLSNSSHMKEALRKLNYEDCSACGSCAGIEWEIEVEVGRSGHSEREEEDREIILMGSSRALRMDDGSWFAHTLPSRRGVGFVFVPESECHQARRITAYLACVFRFVSDDESESTHARVVLETI